MKQDGHTVLLTTHDIDEAEELCDRIAIIDHGRIIATGAPHELVARSTATAVGVARHRGAARSRGAREPAGRAGAVVRRRPGALPHGDATSEPRRSRALRDVCSSSAGHARDASIDLHGARRPRSRTCFIELTGRPDGPETGRTTSETCMNGLLQQLEISLRLHFRNKMALLYGYLFPLIFLVVVLGALPVRERPARAAHGRAADRDGARRRLLRPADDDGERAGAGRLAALPAGAGLHARR